MSRFTVHGSKFKAMAYGCVLVSCALFLAPLSASQLPSLFRGVVVADSPAGVRVISVEEQSQAFLANLRPEDVIVSINGTSVHSIDEFATWSSQAKGQAIKAMVVIRRNGDPKELLFHLYSYPVLTHWGLAFVPDYDLRFAEPRAGLEYWARLGRGYETAGNQEAALNAYLNALHNEPTFVDAAVKVSDVLWVIAQQRLAAHKVSGAVQALEQETRLLNKLFEYPLTDEDLLNLKRRLEETIRIIHQSRQHT